MYAMYQTRSNSECWWLIWRTSLITHTHTHANKHTNIDQSEATTKIQRPITKMTKMTNWKCFCCFWCLSECVSHILFDYSRNNLFFLAWLCKVWRAICRIVRLICSSGIDRVLMLCIITQSVSSINHNLQYTSSVCSCSFCLCYCCCQSPLVFKHFD